MKDPVVLKAIVGRNQRAPRPVRPETEDKPSSSRAGSTTPARFGGNRRWTNQRLILAIQALKKALRGLDMLLLCSFPEDAETLNHHTVRPSGQSSMKALDRPPFS